MPRPPRFAVDDLLDAALAITVDRTPAGLAVADVARRAGAPSGSVYHRFPTRAALLGELRVRSVELFHEGLRTALAHGEPHDAARAAAGHVVRWSLANPDHARLLLFAHREFLPDEWPAPVAERVAATDRWLASALRKLARELSMPVEQILVAVVDLPLAVVRRHLTSGSGLRAGAVAVVESCVDALLATPVSVGEDGPAASRAPRV